jgi:hypothetical protein
MFMSIALTRSTNQFSYRFLGALLLTRRVFSYFLPGY